MYVEQKPKKKLYILYVKENERIKENKESNKNIVRNNRKVTGGFFLSLIL